MTDLLAPDRWQRVVELFEGAAALPESARAGWLAEQCGGDAELRQQVESLLESDRCAAGFGDGIARALRDEADSVQETPPFERIGRYKLIEELGRGGMGTVYLAERDDGIGGRVAIKLLRAVAGPELAARFRAERQILASLEHPGLARLIDGGTTPGGLPYLVMEVVDGVPIDVYCETHRLGLRPRLELFRQVCDAVSYAHRSLVVHRDIKPSNVLATADGKVKLLDFGIAKLLGPGAAAASLTTPSLRLLTPEYASPEQIRGEPITTATDVYSLGALLYELLTGTRPRRFESRQLDAMSHALATTAIQRPSAAVTPGSRRARDLTGDLDTIVLAALETDPSRRYSSVDRLSADLRRFLDGHPIEARPATWGYRARRFVSRHRAGVAAVAVFAVLVVAMSAVLARSFVRAERERAAAEQVSAILVEIFAAPARTDGESAGSVTARARLDAGVERVRRDLSGQPALQARLFEAIGAIYAGLGLTADAQTILRESMERRRAAGVADSVGMARTMWRLSEALRDRGDLGAAEPLVRDAIEMSARAVGRVNPQTGQMLNTLGTILLAQGRGGEAEPLFQEAAGVFQNTLGPAHPMMGATLANLAAARRDRGDLGGAERIARESIAIRDQTLGAALGDSLELLADVAAARGHGEEAEALRREAARRRSGVQP